MRPAASLQKNSAPKIERSKDSRVILRVVEKYPLLLKKETINFVAGNNGLHSENYWTLGNRGLRWKPPNKNEAGIPHTSQTVTATILRDVENVTSAMEATVLGFPCPEF